MKALESLPALPNLSEINLRGNPLGLTNIDPLEYIAAMRALFPNLVRLDEQPLNDNACSVAQKNYLCSVDGYDVIDQFVKQYFETFDGKVSRSLTGMWLLIAHYYSYRNTLVIIFFSLELYRPSAILTFSCSVAGNEFTDKQLRKYVVRSRNLNRINIKPGVDLGPLPTFVGGAAIMHVWTRLGKTQHDYPSFTIDMTHFSVC